MSEFARELSDLVAGLARDGDDHPDSRWAQVCDLGLAGIGIADERGGSGGSVADLMVVIEQLARAGIATPIVEASTAAYATGEVPGDSFDTVALAHDLTVTDTALSAEFAHVPHVAAARRLVIVTASSVMAVPLAQPGVDVEPACDIAGIPGGSVRLHEVSPTLVANGPAAAEVADRLALARSCALLGSACGAYELTRDYVTHREQFGAPLIKIPAVAAALAQMTVRIRSAQSALQRAIMVCTDPPDAGLRRSGAVAAARIAAAQTATLVARSAHQLHGAVGFTAEYPLHRYTTALWAGRDADEPEREYCRRLGSRARTAGETLLWEQISA